MYVVCGYGKLQVAITANHFTVALQNVVTQWDLDVITLCQVVPLSLAEKYVFRRYRSPALCTPDFMASPFPLS